MSSHRCSHFRSILFSWLLILCLAVMSFPSAIGTPIQVVKLAYISNGHEPSIQFNVGDRGNGSSLAGDTCNSHRAFMCSLYDPIPNLPGRQYHTPPSTDCRRKGFDAMTPWLVNFMCGLIVIIFGLIGLWPLHQFLFVAIKSIRLNRVSITSGSQWLKSIMYTGMAIVCGGRCLSHAFDPFSYTGRLPLFIGRYNSMAATTTLFTIYSMFLLVWLRSITHPHHAKCHAFPTSHQSSQCTQNKPLPTETLPTPWSAHIPQWLYCMCRSQTVTHYNNTHALVLYSHAVFGCIGVNLFMWAREFAFLFILTQEQIAMVKSYFALGSMGVLILAMALLVLGVNHITVRFEECQPPPLHLDDILIVPYKPGHTSILDVTVRPRAQPVQPLPTRIARLLTGLMLVTTVIRLAVGNSALYPPGTADIWLCVHGLIFLMEACTLLLVIYGLIVTPDGDEVEEPNSCSGTISSHLYHPEKTTEKVKCPFLTSFRIGNRHTYPSGDVHSREASIHQNLTLTPLNSPRSVEFPPWTLETTPKCSSPESNRLNSPVLDRLDQYKSGLPSAHTFEQQFLAAHGRTVDGTLRSSNATILTRTASASSLGFTSPLLPPPPLHQHKQPLPLLYPPSHDRTIDLSPPPPPFRQRQNYTLSRADGHRGACPGSGFYSINRIDVRHPRLKRTLNVSNGMRMSDPINLVTDSGSCDDGWNPQGPVGW